MASPYIIGAPDVLTRLYPNGIIEAFAAENPTFGLFPKKDILKEAGRELNWELSTGSGDAGTMSEAETDQSPSIHKRPFITRSKEYGTATVDRETLMATQDKDAIVEVWDLAIKSCILNIKQSWGIHAYRDGSGTRGQVKSASSGKGTKTLLLQNANDVKLFRISMWIQGAGLSGSTYTLRSTGTKIQITGRSIGAGSLTAATNWTDTISELTESDYLGRAGDINGSPGVVKGLGAWIPATAPTTGDSFFSLDRSTMGEGAYGHRPTSTSSSLYNIGVDAAAYLFDMSCTAPDIWLVNSLDKAAIIKDLSGISMITIPSQNTKGEVIGTIGYDAVRIAGPNGSIDVVSDPFIPRGSSWMGNRETVAWWTMGDLVSHITLGMGEQGGYVTSGNDSISIRFGGFGQMVVENPYQWAYVALPTS